MVKLSIITVNYNGLADTCALVDSLQQHLSTPYELLVVDNASLGDQATVLEQRYPHITVIRSATNLGFAGGNNLGLRQATGDYLLLLNNDTVVEDDSIGALIARLDSDPRIGVVSPKIRFAYGPRHIQFAGYRPLSRITLRNSLVGFDTPDTDAYNTAARTPYAHGAAMMLKREVLERAGAMPEMYFLYYEELDWCERITEQGYELWYEPLCTVFHKESSSTGADSPLRVRYITRNRLLFAERNRRGVIRLLSIVYQCLVAAPKNALVYLLKGRPLQAKAIVEGCFAFFKRDRQERLYR